MFSATVRCPSTWLRTILRGGSGRAAWVLGVVRRAHRERGFLGSGSRPERRGVVRPSTWLRTSGLAVGGWFGGLTMNGRFLRCWDFWGLSGTWGWLSWPVGPGGGFWGLGLCLSIVMVESRHRKWQGAIVSDLCGAGCLVGLLRSFDGVGDEGTGCFVRPSVRPSTGLRMNGLAASGWVVGGAA